MEKRITKKDFEDICKEVAADFAIEFAKDKDKENLTLALMVTLITAGYTAEVIRELFKETEEIIIVEKE